MTGNGITIPAGSLHVGETLHLRSEGTIFIDPDCLACAACGELIGCGPYTLTASNAAVHPECVDTADCRKRYGKD